MNNYTVYEFFTKDEIERDWLVSILTDFDFDGYEETSESIKGFVPTGKVNDEKVKGILSDNEFQHIDFSSKQLENKNWNEEWEKNFEPLVIAKQCYVRASFHPERPEYPYEVIINPKMSFGTGHHATTSLMLEYELETDMQNKSVVDAGCGTGILSILAQKRGASVIKAFDIEDWAFENLIENCNLNGCNRIETGQGTISQIIQPEEQFDIVLANINKNVLLAEMDEYNKHLHTEGLLFLSGFYEEDEKDILSCASDAGFRKESSKVKDRWMSMKLIKINE